MPTVRELAERKPISTEAARHWFAQKELEVSDWFWEVFDAIVDINSFEDDPVAIERALVIYFNNDCRRHLEEQALSPWDWCLHKDPQIYAQDVYEKLSFKQLLAEKEQEIGGYSDDLGYR